MTFLRTGIILLLVFGLGACAVLGNQAQIVNDDGRYEILDVLPESLNGFFYEGVRTYPEPGGYSLRYRFNPRQLIHSDIYIYPVPEEMTGDSHQEIIYEMTNQALREIQYALEEGYYSKYQVINTGTFMLDDNLTTRVDIFLIRDNLASFSLLFLTQKQGILVKTRITMPDNGPNRNNDLWQDFVEDMFSVILINIDKV